MAKRKRKPKWLPPKTPVDSTNPFLVQAQSTEGWPLFKHETSHDAGAPQDSSAVDTITHSRDRAGKHPQAHLANYTGIFQADAYEGYGKLYEGSRAPGPILEAACWVHARRPFFVMADLAENARRKAQGKKP